MQLLYNKMWYPFTCQPGIHICLCLWISVCSSISRRVAFSREIWRAIYRSLPEHQAWCCCCCFYLSLLLTTPASVSLSLSPSLYVPPSFPVLFVFWAPFLVISSPFSVSLLFQYIFVIAGFHVNYWLEQNGGDWLCGHKLVLGQGILAWLIPVSLLQSFKLLFFCR